MKVLYLLIGSLGLVLTILALILPIIPATPFLLITLFGFSRGSQRIYYVLISLPFIKPLYHELQINGYFTFWQRIGLTIVTLPMAIAPFILIDNKASHYVAVIISTISIVVIWLYRHPNLNE